MENDADPELMLEILTRLGQTIMRANDLEKWASTGSSISFFSMQQSHLLLGLINGLKFDRVVGLLYLISIVISSNSCKYLKNLRESIWAFQLIFQLSYTNKGNIYLSYGLHAYKLLLIYSTMFTFWNLLYQSIQFWVSDASRLVVKGYLLILWLKL